VEAAVGLIRPGCGAAQRQQRHDRQPQPQRAQTHPDAKIRTLRGACQANSIAQPITGARWMAGYSGTPLPQKLGIKAGHRVVLLDASDGFAATLGPLPDGARIVAGRPGAGNVVLLFAAWRA